MLDSVDSQVLANSFKSHPVRVIEDGVKPIKPEAKCDWPGAGEFELSVAAFADRA